MIWPISRHCPTSLFCRKVKVGDKEFQVLLNDTSSLDTFQSGIGRATLHGLIALVGDLYLEIGRHVSAVFIDLFALFDQVDYIVLQIFGHRVLTCVQAAWSCSMVLSLFNAGEKLY